MITENKNGIEKETKAERKRPKMHRGKLWNEEIGGYLSKQELKMKKIIDGLVKDGTLNLSRDGDTWNRFFKTEFIRRINELAKHWCKMYFKTILFKKELTEGYGKLTIDDKYGTI